MSTAIKFDNISKQYRLGLVSTRTLSHDMNRWWKMNVLGKEDPYLKIGEVNDRAHKGNSEYVWALKDINFEVEQGDVLGIIGKNGAGKSTLLKILSKVTAPTTGTIKAAGRIASLLEVGTGFHPEMTGRENIYMNGAIMGMTKSEISRKLDEIVDFSGVERYLDTPVKRYSSGMTVRLGFAIAAHLEPEILVVDEVLAVGDAEFQKKAIGKMQDVSRGQGRTVLFVSHNMGAVRSLCNKGVLLENGTVIKTGSVYDVIDYYLTRSNNLVNTPLFKRKDRLGSKEVYIEEIFLLDDNDKKIYKIISGQNFKICFKYKKSTKKNINDIVLGLNFFDSNDTPMFLVHNRLFSQNLVFKDEGILEVYFTKFPFNEGEYKMTYSLMSKNGHGDFLDLIHNAFVLKVEKGNFYKSNELPPISFGPILINASFYD